MRQYFGVKWDAPAYEDAVEVPTPLGESCLYCREPIVEGESGLMMPYVGNDGAAVMAAGHIECELRSMLGSVAHLEGRCSCCGGAGNGDAGRASYREAARETMSWLIEHGR